jgi:DNA-binding protein
MQETNKENAQEQIKPSEDSVIVIYSDPVMQSALDAISVLAKYGEITIRSTGNSIPNAIAVANIIHENIMRGNSKIYKITVGSEPIQELGRTLSNIEIIIRKT